MMLEKYMAMEAMAYSQLILSSLSDKKMETPPPVVEMRAIVNSLPARELGWYGIATEKVDGALVAIIPIMDSMSSWSMDWIKYNIQLAQGNDAVVGVVLKMSSGGGSVNGLWDLADEIKGAQKPMIAHVSYMGASAAYLCASQCREIFLNDKFSSVGSIGTIQAILSQYEKMQKEGIKAIVLRSKGSENKSVLHPFEPLDENDPLVKAALEKEQKMIDAMREEFLYRVRSVRKKVSADIDGEMYAGKEAISMGLADTIGNLEAAVVRAAYLGLK